MLDRNTFYEKQAQYEELKELLESSPLPELADRLHELPNERIEALFNMVAHLKANKTQRAVYRYQVLQDVLNVLNGTKVKNFSDAFLTTTTKEHE